MANPLKFRCPVCGAKPGHSCVGIWASHPERGKKTSTSVSNSARDIEERIREEKEE